MLPLNRPPPPLNHRVRLSKRTHEFQWIWIWFVIGDKSHKLQLFTKLKYQLSYDMHDLNFHTWVVAVVGLVSFSGPHTHTLVQDDGPAATHNINPHSIWLLPIVYRLSLELHFPLAISNFDIICSGVHDMHMSAAAQCNSHMHFDRQLQIKFMGIIVTKVLINTDRFPIQPNTLGFHAELKTVILN